MSSSFPFVPLPPNLPLSELLDKRPILVFAILIVAKFETTVLLQLRMASQFRKIIVSKVSSGEWSLDFLQGLLVFLAWHHRYMEKKSALPMLLRICVGIAEDLELDNRTSGRGTESLSDAEGKRAYLGCYYLATWLSACGVGKVNVPQSETIKRYAIELEAAHEYDTDKLLPTIVQLSSILQDIDGLFSTGPMTLAAMKWHSEYFRNLLNYSARSYTPQLSGNGAVVSKK